MLSHETIKRISQLAIENNYSAILDLIEAELQKESGHDVYAMQSVFLLDHLLKAAEDPKLFDRAIHHLSKIQSVCTIDNTEKFETFRKIFSNADNGITLLQKVTATKVLFSSEQNFAKRLGLHILKTKIFTLDFIVKQLQLRLSEYPNKVLALLSDYAVDISREHFFNDTLQNLIQKSATKNKSIRITVDDTGHTEYVKQVKIVSRMLALIIPINNSTQSLSAAFKFCRDILSDDDKNHLFAIEFLKNIEKKYPGILTESYLFKKQPFLLARYELIFELNEDDDDDNNEVYRLSQIGLALLKKHATDEEVMALFKQSVSELTDKELKSVVSNISSHNDIPPNVLACLKLDSQGPSEVKRLKLNPQQPSSHSGSLPSFRQLLENTGISWPLLQPRFHEQPPQQQAEQFQRMQSVPPTPIMPRNN
jgi:hypothetical protein